MLHVSLFVRSPPHFFIVFFGRSASHRASTVRCCCFATGCWFFVFLLPSLRYLSPFLFIFEVCCPKSILAIFNDFQGACRVAARPFLGAHAMRSSKDNGIDVSNSTIDKDRETQEDEQKEIDGTNGSRLTFLQP